MRQLSDFETVCRVDELQRGTAKRVVVGETPVAIFIVENEVFALDDRCPHAGASLSRGYIEGDIIRCRIHHWGFRIRDGLYIDADSPCHNARRIEARILDGEVQVKK